VESSCECDNGPSGSVKFLRGSRVDAQPKVFRIVISSIELVSTRDVGFDVVTAVVNECCHLLGYSAV
jgi:hypothetical protein